MSHVYHSEKKSSLQREYYRRHEQLPLLSSTSPKHHIDECLWALQYPELQKACFLAKVCPEDPPKYCQYRDMTGILQVGPTCGLTILSMLLGGTPSPQQLLVTAKNLHYTNNGEMFSARNFFQLICDHLINAHSLPSADNSRERNARECVMHEGRLNCAKVRDCLLAGDCIFVPYDPDFNHAPCIKFGHKAHWALIIGCLIDNNEEFFVLARHAKTKNLAAWSLAELSESNSSLFEFSQPKGYPDYDFLLPPGGIGGKLGLRERAIIVKGLSHAKIFIR